MASPIAQSDVTLGDLDRPSPDYLEIEWEDICRLHIYLWCTAMTLGRLWAGRISPVPAVFLVFMGLL